MNTVLWNK